ncbi:MULTISPECIES: hypothetical protein [Pseudomonas]|uniref:Uncharacterized protein n=1 Tax=Pseudomonas hygromyciniae TaxID=2812000 RepID=A0ABX7K450_9PSED|nr:MULTISPECIES: hypothetical protein [Pseudomonas]NMX90695.1 hypothetical protein [Pseudomonas sp. WS 5086]NMY45643.1 hypothetical protein [Pseudomonas sp. WS 5027]QSB42431.1 hypothetical protein JTY93_18610 [Pseudomonas hygromyciniae]
MPAKIVNDNAANLIKHGALAFFAGKPAPTGGSGRLDKYKSGEEPWLKQKY